MRFGGENVPKMSKEGYQRITKLIEDLGREPDLLGKMEAQRKAERLQMEKDYQQLVKEGWIKPKKPAGDALLKKSKQTVKQSGKPE